MWHEGLQQLAYIGVLLCVKYTPTSDRPYPVGRLIGSQNSFVFNRSTGDVITAVLSASFGMQ